MASRGARVPRTLRLACGRWSGSCSEPDHSTSGPGALTGRSPATTERAASIYVWLLAESLMQRHHAAGLTLEEARERLTAQPLLVELFDERIEQTDDPHADASFLFRTGGVPDTEAQVRCQGEVVAERARLQAGHGNPHLLGRAAQAYFGNTAYVAGESPGERLGRLVGSQTDLAADLRNGLLGVLGRDDLPSPSDVVAGSDAMPALTIPYMAALNELERSGRLQASGLSDGQVRLAVTILHSVPAETGHGSSPRIRTPCPRRRRITGRSRPSFACRLCARFLPRVGKRFLNRSAGCSLRHSRIATEWNFSGRSGGGSGTRIFLQRSESTGSQQDSFSHPVGMASNSRSSAMFGISWEFCSISCAGRDPGARSPAGSTRISCDC